MYVRKFRSDSEVLREECRAVTGTRPEIALSFGAAMVLLVFSGMSAVQLAQCGAVAERTIMGWVESAHAGGVGSLRGGRRTVRPPRLDEAQTERLTGVLAEGPADTGLNRAGRLRARPRRVRCLPGRALVHERDQ